MRRDICVNKTLAYVVNNELEAARPSRVKKAQFEHAVNTRDRLRYQRNDKRTVPSRTGQKKLGVVGCLYKFPK